MIYDLVANNVSSEVRGKIDEIAQKIAHPLAPAVVKAICLLQLVPNLHSTAENLAAVLHPAVDADSRLPEVKAALAELAAASLIRQSPLRVTGFPPPPKMTGSGNATVCNQSRRT